MLEAAHRLSTFEMPVTFLQPAADPADHILHHAEIIEDRDEGGEEDDDGQRLNREILPQRIGGKPAEEEFGAFIGIAQQVGYASRRALQNPVAPRHIEHQRSQPRLQRKGRQHDARADRLAVGGQQEGDRKDQHHSGKAHQDLHIIVSPSLFLCRHPREGGGPAPVA
jgi:hypothetical protein